MIVLVPAPVTDIVLDNMLEQSLVHVLVPVQQNP